MRKMSWFTTMAAILPFMSLLLASGCAKKADNSPPARYQMRGQVLRLDPSLHIAVIKHEKIEGWMEAMTMEYPIRDPQEFQKLRADENIQATVFVKGDDYWVGEIREAPASPAAVQPAAEKPAAEKSGK
jgi:Cu/Ag efflux protein CusF